MASDIGDDEDFQETRVRRIARYWGTAADAYRLAFTAESEEARKTGIRMALAWAALADELERVPIMPALPPSPARKPH